MSEKRTMAEIKDMLTQRKIRLEEELTMMSKEQFSDGQVQDPGDQALTATMESLHLSLQESEVDEYRRILRALEKIEDNSYGICIDCGNPVSEKRLQLFPDTTRCLGCQEEFEEKHKHPHYTL